MLAWRGTTTLFALYAVAALLGVARAFAGPALQALAPNLVPRAILPRAIALSSIAWQAGAIAGPAIGGYLYAWTPFAPYAASAALFAIAFIGLLAIGPVARPEIARGPSPWAQMVEGLSYVRHNRLVLGAISLDLFAVLLGGATALLPVFARDVLHAGPEGLGHLRAAPAVGATLTALFFSVRPLKYNVGAKMLVAVGIFGTATVIFGLSRWMPLSLACLGASRRRRHVLGLRPPVADPALHAGRDARPRRGGLFTVHFRVQRAWRDRIRLFGSADRAGRLGHRRRRSGRSEWSFCGRGGFPSCALQKPSNHPICAEFS